MTNPYIFDAAQISPSILNCDFMQIGAELDRISNADFAHVDVMDNHFVPNLTFGVAMAEQIVKRSPIPVDAHLMIEDPDRWAPQYAEAGCTSVTFHLEVAKAPVRLARELRSLGTAPCVALKPATPLSAVEYLLREVDMVLIMTVEPGFGGQSFIDSQVAKIRELRQKISADNLSLSIQVDGGVNRKTIELAAEAGANVFVAGSAVYSAEDAHAEIDTLRAMASKHVH